MYLYIQKGVFLSSKWAFPIVLKGVAPKNFPGAWPPDPHPFLHPHFATAGAAAVQFHLLALQFSFPNENIFVINQQLLNLFVVILWYFRVRFRAIFFRNSLLLVWIFFLLCCHSFHFVDQLDQCKILCCLCTK